MCHTGSDCCEIQVAQVKSPAPPFELDAVVNRSFAKIRLSDYKASKGKKGKWVVLFFYPLDFTFVCPTEIIEFSNRAAEFAKEGAVVLGCSTDSKFSHLAWIERGDLGDLKIPLLADFTKETAAHYGVLLEGGMALRGTFLIDPDGILRWSVVHDLSVGRNVDEVLRALQALKTGELCPVGWKPGAKFLKA
jgi:alkyl hydroperoxide reductase subunit AhpC